MLESRNLGAFEALRQRPLTCTAPNHESRQATPRQFLRYWLVAMSSRKKTTRQLYSSADTLPAEDRKNHTLSTPRIWETVSESSARRSVVAVAPKSLDVERREASLSVRWRGGCVGMDEGGGWLALLPPTSGTLPAAKAPAAAE